MTTKELSKLPRIELPGELTAVSLELPRNLSAEDWALVGHQLGAIHDASLWWVGDWANFGENKYGEKFAQYVEATGLEYPTIKGARRISRNFELDRRRSNLTWSHHQEVGAFEPQTQDQLLDVAEEREMNRSDFRDYVRLYKQGLNQAAASAINPKQYNVILADPPWEYSNTGVHGAAEHHYPTMALDKLFELPQTIGLQFADNAVLFMWVTNPLLDDAFALVQAWGFEYKTNIVWVKTELKKPGGGGFYVRGRHELLFICTRGSFTPLDKNIAPPIGSVITAPLGEHSEKPDEAYQIIERLYPNCHYIELFARQKRSKWDAWGNQVS